MLSTDITMKLPSNTSWTRSNNSVWVRKMIVNETGDYKNSNQLKIFQRNICFKIQIWRSMICNKIRNPLCVSFCEILEQQPSRIILGGFFCKQAEQEKDAQWPLRFQVFTFFQSIYLLSHETIPVQSCICQISIKTMFQRSFSVWINVWP